MTKTQTSPPKWIEEAKQLYSNGKSFKQIAETVKVAPATVQRWFKLLNIEVRSPGGRCRFDVNVAAQMWEQGCTIDQIASSLGANRTAVYEQLKKNGFDTSARWHTDKEQMSILIREGLADRTIAERMGCSVNVVERYRRGVLGQRTERFTNAQDVSKKVKNALMDPTVGFEELRGLFPNVPYSSLVRYFNKHRPGEWVSKIKNGPIDPTNVPAVIEALQRGDSIRAIAGTYATTPRHIYSLIVEYSINYVPRAYRIDATDHERLTDPNWCEVVLDSHPAGGAKWIANEVFGGRLSPDTVRGYFRQHGLDPSPLPIAQLVPELTDREWMASRYETMTVTEIADELGVSHPVVRDAMIAVGITPTRQHHVSKVEKQILEFIKSTYSGPIIENDRTIIYPKELDIVLPDLQIAIEVCGMYWHSEKFKDKWYHREKMESANQAGYRLITLYEEEVSDPNLTPITWRKLSHILGITTTKPVNARSCTIVELTSSEAGEFLKQNHIQGYMKASIRYGLKCGNDVVAVVTFKSFADGVYELSRFATSTRVRGGFTKLLNHFKKNNTWSTIFTFADLRWSSRTDNVYVTAGFTEVYATQPAYRYYCNKTKKSYHRMHFQRKHLARRLQTFDPTLTERQNVNNNGLLAIYDCGNVKYKMTNPINPS